MLLESYIQFCYHVITVPGAEILSTIAIKAVKEGAIMATQHQYDDGQTSDLIINIHPQLRRRLTVAAAQSNLSVEEYVGSILEQVVPPEANNTQRSGRLNRAAVDELLKYREEIKRAHPGQVFEDSVELLRLRERTAGRINRVLGQSSLYLCRLGW